MTIAEAIAGLMICLGIPLLTVAGALLPYGTRYVLMNALLIAAIGLGAWALNQAGLPETADGEGNIVVLILCVGLAMWFALVHLVKVVGSGLRWFAHRWSLRRRRRTAIERGMPTE